MVLLALFSFYAISGQVDEKDDYDEIISPKRDGVLIENVNDVDKKNDPRVGFLEVRAQNGYHGGGYGGGGFGGSYGDAGQSYGSDGGYGGGGYGDAGQSYGSDGGYGGGGYGDAGESYGDDGDHGVGYGGGGESYNGGGGTSYYGNGGSYMGGNGGSYMVRYGGGNGGSYMGSNMGRYGGSYMGSYGGGYGGRRSRRRMPKLPPIKYGPWKTTYKTPYIPKGPKTVGRRASTTPWVHKSTNYWKSPIKHLETRVEYDKTRWKEPTYTTKVQHYKPTVTRYTSPAKYTFTYKRYNHKPKNFIDVREWTPWRPSTPRPSYHRSRPSYHRSRPSYPRTQPRYRPSSRISFYDDYQEPAPYRPSSRRSFYDDYQEPAPYRPSSRRSFSDHYPEPRPNHRASSFDDYETTHSNDSYPYEEDYDYDNDQTDGYTPVEEESAPEYVAD